MFRPSGGFIWLETVQTVCFCGDFYTNSAPQAKILSLFNAFTLIFFDFEYFSPIFFLYSKKTSRFFQPLLILEVRFGIKFNRIGRVFGFLRCRVVLPLRGAEIPCMGKFPARGMPRLLDCGNRELIFPSSEGE